ncbi:hypothetical protein AMTR_s03938p00001570, partial [Amborella trichopoda]
SEASQGSSEPEAKRVRVAFGVLFSSRRKRETGWGGHTRVRWSDRWLFLSQREAERDREDERPLGFLSEQEKERDREQEAERENERPLGFFER